MMSYQVEPCHLQERVFACMQAHKVQRLAAAASMRLGNAQARAAEAQTQLGEAQHAQQLLERERAGLQQQLASLQSQVLPLQIVPVPDCCTGSAVGGSGITRFSQFSVPSCEGNLPCSRSMSFPAVQ